MGAFAACALAASQVGAATIIPIANAGFETPGGGGFPQATGWDGSARIAPHANFVRDNSAGLGASFAFNTPESAPASQTLPEAYVANQTYTFKSFGVVSSTPNTNLRYILGYDAGAGFVQLAEQTYVMSDIDAWTELDGVSYTTGSSDPANGQNIIVRISAIGASGQGGWFDNASLTYIPEPPPRFSVDSVCSPFFVADGNHRGITLLFRSSRTFLAHVSPQYPSALLSAIEIRAAAK